MTPLLQTLADFVLLLNNAISTLRAYSLVQHDPATRTLSIHRLVQAILQDRMEEAEHRLWSKRAVLVVNAAFPHVEHRTWAQCERALQHALLAAQYIETDNIISEEAGCLLHKTATYISVRVRYPESERFHQRAMRIREQQLGPEHPDVAHSLSDLADVYQVQGKYAEAEFLYQRALHIREQVLGLQHPDTAETMLTFRESLKVPYLLSARSRGRN